MRLRLLVFLSLLLLLLPRLGFCYCLCCQLFWRRQHDTHCSMVSTFTYDKPEFCLSSACRAAAAAASRYTIRSSIPLQPACLSTHPLCCAEHSCPMAWPSSISEPSPKLAPQQQMKSSPSTGFPRTLSSQVVLSKEGCSRGASTVKAVLMVTLSLALSLFLRCSALCVAGAQAPAARPGGCVSAMYPPCPFII